MSMNNGMGQSIRNKQGKKRSPRKKREPQGNRDLHTFQGMREDKLQVCCPICGYRLAKIPRYSCSGSMEIECGRCHSQIGVSSYGESLTVGLLVAASHKESAYDDDLGEIPFL